MRKSPASSDKRTVARHKTPHAKKVTDQAPDGSTTARATTYEPFLGIDFGTSYSAMASVHPETGQANILCNAEGEEKTRSAVYFGSKGQIEVGKYAEQYLEDETESDRVLLSFKRDLAKNIVSGIVDGKPIRPLDVAVQVFAKLKHDAEKANFHSLVRRAVVTVPASFDPLQKDAIKEAAHKAGFDEVVTLDEPVAAAIAYSKEVFSVGRRLLVFDLGAGTFDTTVLDRHDDDERQPFRLALESRGIQVGGDDFDRALMDHALEALPALKDNRSLAPVLLHQCRNLKEALSRHHKHTLIIPSPAGQTLTCEIRRSTFETLIREHVTLMVRLSAELAETAKSDGRAVDTLVLIGGSAHIPLVTRMLAKSVLLKPRAWQRQDLAVALGAAYYGEILWGSKAAHRYREAIRRLAREEQLTLLSLRDTQQERADLGISIARAEPIENNELGQPLDAMVTARVPSAKVKYAELHHDAEGEPLERFRIEGKALGLTDAEMEEVESRASSPPTAPPHPTGLVGAGPGDGGPESPGNGPGADLVLPIVVAIALLSVVIVGLVIIVMGLQDRQSKSQFSHNTRGTPPRQEDTLNVSQTRDGEDPLSKQKPPAAPSATSFSQTRDGEEPSSKPVVPREITNTIGMKLVLIPPGEFMMGSREDRGSGEGSPRKFTIWRPFYLGMYEVTQDEYEWVMGMNPSAFSRDRGGSNRVSRLDTSRFPVENVSWIEAVEFCRKLSALPGERSAVREYRLPTEAVWEYACRAGTTTRYHVGDNLDTNQARFAQPSDFGRPVPVGSYSPNGFGLYDMHGNVWELCEEWPASGSDRVIRGGGWNDSAWYCRSAYREWAKPDARACNLGFRVALVPMEESSE